MPGWNRDVPLLRQSPRVALVLRWIWTMRASRVDYRTRPCGSLLPNDLGLFDLLGNVIEWCHDRQSESAIIPAA